MPQRTLFGHPAGLFTLFFAEMWERFSYYGMRALLVFYMLKGFLGYGDSDAYAVYGSYTALVYMTPFFGGLLADRLLGARRAVVLGGLLMAAGHLMMTVESQVGFFGALALLICGNGFFKPNISTIVGSLYPPGSPRRDGGFTIFYMGINLGAAMSPLLCGYVGETFGWHYGFGLATIGMLVGVAVFVAPSLISQVLLFLLALGTAFNIFLVPELVAKHTAISELLHYSNYVLLGALVLAGWVTFRELARGKLEESLLSVYLARLVIVAGAIAAAVALFRHHPDNPFSTGVNIFVGVALLIAAVVAWVALGRGGLPKEAGAPPDAERLRRPVLGPISAESAVYLGTLAALVLFVLLVSGFAFFTHDHRPMTLIPNAYIDKLAAGEGALMQIAAVFLQEMSRPAGLVLMLAGLGAVVYLGYETFRLDQIRRQRMFVILTLTFFSMLFWAFFEQAGSSVNNFTDRNVDRVFEKGYVTADMVGQTIQIQPTQEQCGYHNGDQLFTLNVLDELRDKNKGKPDFTIAWKVAEDNVGMGLAKRVDEIPASTFQSANPIYILLFGLVFTALWTFLGKRGWEPSTPVKFAVGLLQLGLGFGFFWYGAMTSNDRGMVALTWLYLGYLFQTTGELCISPVGLSMITKLSPGHLVSTVMGTWFLATAFSQYLAAIISQFTGVKHEGEDGGTIIPPPIDTVHLYGSVFGKIAIAAGISAIICFALSPILTRWMHQDKTLEA
ncbi:MAG TPA: oligopeptide:H+ symporter [Phycisphaerae bacterium]|nr:oligopeptide:H+ symporter [Phycisphaerae bacterium]HOJ53440.1 oligopeptide:H+ symporter [Phycisphaerae bacterium]HOL25436.1 oligopeptide:H+ symporter [Phycisphaerae bacterium]HPP19887.1 oligopeptide:H+ symporter [Phycisphaerae bacterium]HPU31187.1 oligopeptide:H+ symporter [Phycisphaerae bacterium]